MIHHDYKVRWNKEEKALFNGSLTLIEISKKTGRTYASVNSFYRKNRKRFNLVVNQDTVKEEILKHTMNGKSRAWIIENYKVSPNYVSKIRGQVLEDGKKRFTQEEIEYIIKNHSSMKIKEIAEVLKRSYGSITNIVMRLKKIGLIECKKNHIVKPHIFTEEKVEKIINFIKENYGVHKLVYMAYYLKISESTVSNYIKRLKEVGEL